jgi:hypothetical protein
VVTSTTTNPNEELENYICTMNEADGSGAATPPVHIEFETFVSPINRLTYNSRSHHLSPNNTEQLIVYAAPVIQSQLAARCRETSERLKEIKKEKTALVTTITKTPTKHLHQQQQQREDPQQ